MDINYTTKSQETISGTVRATAATSNPQIESVHLLVGLLSQPDDAAAEPLATVYPDAAAH